LTTARSARAGWYRGVAGLALALALALATIATGAVTASPASASPGIRGSCGKASGPFSVHGTQVLDGSGNAFVSYGITVPGLQVRNWQGQVQLDLAKIAATASDWCANTVRLQVSQDNLLGPNGTGFSKSFMAAIKSEVSLAERDQLVVVLNDTTEFTAPGGPGTEMEPTAGTQTFWKDMTGVYGNDPQVIFDLFNEPRAYYRGMAQAQEWQLWRNGGSYGGTSYPFGMAKLAAYVRNTVHARNLFWVEGPDYSASFAGMVQQGARLQVSGVVYALHHPAGPQDTASWDNDFGYLIRTGVGPVVDGEWTNYEPAPTSYPTGPRSSCWPQAPSRVPEYLHYLASLDVGLNAYQLQPGYLIKSSGNLADPTTIDSRTWSCTSNAEAEPGQGVGFLLLTWFELRND
jgi:hypothetical protein